MFDNSLTDGWSFLDKEFRPPPTTPPSKVCIESGGIAYISMMWDVSDHDSNPIQTMTVTACPVGRV